MDHDETERPSWFVKQNSPTKGTRQTDRKKQQGRRRAGVLPDPTQRNKRGFGFVRREALLFVLGALNSLPLFTGKTQVCCNESTQVPVKDILYSGGLVLGSYVLDELVGV